MNFQLGGAQVPNQYVADTGEVFGDRGGGLFYGWSSNHTDVSRDRNINPDQRLDTLVHFHQFQDWELQVPNGTYDVTVSIGDPEHASTHTLFVEGVNYWNAEVLVEDEFRTATQQITVNDGRLTLDQANAEEKATRINYVHVQGLANGANSAPALPTITEPADNSESLNPTDVHMEAVGFTDLDGDAHLSSDWEIWTDGPDAERAWFTLGITGVERLHTHLGDGFFENAHAGRSDLLPDTDYELRVRFRDDAGSVSEFATRTFRTGAASNIFPMELEDIAASPAPTWQDIAGFPIDLPSLGAILSPADPILAIDTDGDSSYPAEEAPPNAIDLTTEKYLNFGEINSGFIVTPDGAAPRVQSFQITTANDAVERDPTSWELYGTNDAITSDDNSSGTDESWTLIDSGTLSLPSARNTLSTPVAVNSTTPFASYRMLFTGVKNADAANSVQIAELQFFGDDGTGGNTPSLRVDSANGDLLLSIEGSDAAGNTIVNPPQLPEHVDVRLVLSGGDSGLALGPTDLSFVDGHGQAYTVYLPSVALAAGETQVLWVASDGSTYFGLLTQSEPDFSMLARAAENPTNFIATQPNFVVETVAEDLQLPVNVAFVPDPGPNPDDPSFYVTELYGTIKVVTNDGTVSDYATDLLNFNPTGNFPGSGEQGLAGIVVEPVSGDVIVTRVTDTDGLPEGEHHPQVVRFTSNDGGLTAATETVLLDMVGESQGQSHQISNVSIGPDGKLYVHNGDGFDASTALNADSFRGKILRMNLDGSAPSDNPFYSLADGINSRDYIFAYGFRNPFGGAWRATDEMLYEVENGPSVDRLAQVVEGGGYGWNGSNESMFFNAKYNWDPAHAPVNITFVQPETFGGSMFPSNKMDRAFVSESGPTYAQGPQVLGKRIVEFEFDSDGNVVGGPTTLVEYVGQGRATVVGLTAGPDGLYFTDLYKDLDANTPIDRGARVLRVRYVPSVPDGDFNDDGLYDALDVDPLVAEIAGGGHDTAFDLTGDGFVNVDDLISWLSEAGAANLPSGNAYLFGDANLDGFVDGLDFIIWNSNKFTSQAAWSKGDFNADGFIDGLDFIVWNSNKFLSAAPTFDIPGTDSTRHNESDPRPQFDKLAPSTDAGTGPVTRGPELTAYQVDMFYRGSSGDGEPNDVERPARRTSALKPLDQNALQDH